MTSFDTCLTILLQKEGGFVNDPHDNGGATNLGVTIGTWSRWLKRPATVEEIKALTPSKVAPLYKTWYWDPVQGDLLPAALGMALFDFGVNAGPARAVKLVQKIVGTGVDGQMGPGTRKSIQQYVTMHGLAELVRQYSLAKKAYYKTLTDWPRFGKGWCNRVDQMETLCLKLCA
jgi:lysozyme family protein